MNFFFLLSDGGLMNFGHNRIHIHIYRKMLRGFFKVNLSVDSPPPYVFSIIFYNVDKKIVSWRVQEESTFEKITLAFLIYINKKLTSLNKNEKTYVRISHANAISCHILLLYCLVAAASLEFEDTKILTDYY